MSRALRKFGSAFVALAMVGSFAGYVVASATAAGASTTTVIVGPGDQAGIKNTTPQQEWAFQDTDTHSGTLSWVSGPAPVPLGTGSLAMGVTNTQHEWLVTNQFGPCASGFPGCTDIPLKLSDITALTYATYRTSGGQMPTLNIEVTPPGDGSGYTTFVYVPDASSYLNNTWQTWDPFNDSTGRWFSTHNVPGGGVFNCAPQSAGCVKTWSQVTTSYPNARVIDGMGPNIGTGGTFQGNVDNFTIGISGNNTVFDFEPDCSTTCYVNGTTGNDLNTGLAGDPLKTIQAGVNKVSAGGTVNVAAGTYTESLTIPKGVTLNGANVGTAGTASRAAESTVQVTSGAGSVFNITTANQVTIDGFHTVFTGSDQTGGLLLSLQANNQLTFKNNLVNNSVYSNALIFDDSAATSVITNNKFDAIGQTGSPGSCVLCPWGTPSIQAAVTITGNTFSNLTDNDGVPAINLSQVTGTVTGNTFTNIHQYGVLLADKLGPLTISSNTFTNIHNDTPMSSSNRGSGIRTFSQPTFVGLVNVNHNTFSGDYNGVRVANDGSPATLTSNFVVNRNSFTSDTNGGITVAAGTLGTALDGTCNWWGASSGPSGAGGGSGDAVSAGVNFNNWLTTSDLNGACATNAVTAGPDQQIPEGSAGNHNVTIPVTLSNPQATPVSVHYATANGLAKKGKDYTALSGTLTIPAGQTVGNIVISVNGDTKGELNENFSVNLSSAVGATLVDSSTTITLLNDDLVIKHIKNASAFEGGAVHFKVQVKYPLAGATTFQVCVQPISTTAGDTNYSVCPATTDVVLPDQSTAVILINVPTVFDSQAEGNESFYLDVTAVGHAGFDAKGKGTIKHNVT